MLRSLADSSASALVASALGGADAGDQKSIAIVRYGQPRSGEAQGE
jgi:hypothetical protein